MFQCTCKVKRFKKKWCLKATHAITSSRALRQLNRKKSMLNVQVYSALTVKPETLLVERV